MKHIVKESKIAILIPYYGQWPEYIQLFFASCERKVPMDIIFITDLTPVPNSPKNVHYVKASYLELMERIEKNLTIKVPDFAPYKLCDFRPAYGLIFEDLTADYEFWGYGDIDLIYGDLSSIFTSDRLAQYDILCLRNDHLHGPLTIYKNSELVNNLFRRNEHWQTLFSSTNYQSFDEFGKSFFHLKPNEPIENFDNDNISVIALKSVKSGEVRLFMESLSKEVICDTKEHLCWTKEAVSDVYTKKKYGFYHWVLEKRAVWFSYPKWTQIPDTFYVTDSGFYTETEYRFYSLFNFMRKTKGFGYWFYLKVTNYLKRKLGIEVRWDTYPRPGFVKKIK